MSREKNKLIPQTSYIHKDYIMHVGSILQLLHICFRVVATWESKSRSLHFHERAQMSYHFKIRSSISAPLPYNDELRLNRQMHFSWLENQNTTIAASRRRRKRRRRRRKRKRRKRSINNHFELTITILFLSIMCVYFKLNCLSRVTILSYYSKYCYCLQISSFKYSSCTFK